MDEKIHKIVEEILQLDPSLSGRRSEVELVVSSMVHSHPRFEVDEHYKEGLRRKILAKLAIQEESSNKLSWRERFMISKFNIGMAAIALVAVTTSAILYEKAYGPVVDSNSEIQIAQTTQIKDLGLNGFGDLKVSVGGGFGGGGGGGSAREVAAPSQQDAKMSAGFGGGGDASVMPYKVYKFKYTGDEFSVDDAQVAVYRKAKNSLNNQSAKLLRGFRLADYGVKDFQNPRVDSLMVSDDKDNGYSVYIDFINGSVNINQNYAQWNTVEKQCSWEQECIKRATGGVVPSDSDVISIAEQFLAENSISKEGLGGPIVSDQQIRLLASARSMDPAFLSPIVAVVYPRIIDGQEAKDESGNPTGVYVNVNIWDRAVSNVSEIGIFNFEKASYTAETNKDRILKLAETGSFYGYESPLDPSAQVETLNLGTPSRGLARTWMTDAQGNGSEIYTEALVFPILNAKDSEYYSEFVTIPLAKDILDKAQLQVAVPMAE